MADNTPTNGLRYGVSNWLGSIFGFRINPEQDQDITRTANNQPSFALPPNEDGAVTISSGGFFGTFVDFEGIARNEIELITRYREMAMQPELESAIEDVVNESIVIKDNGTSVNLNADELDQPEPIKKRLRDEFDTVLKLLDFGNMGHEIYRRWYVDGRLFYHLIIDNTNPSDGIKEIRYIDPRRIRKIREVLKTKDPRTGSDVIKDIREYYLYNERGMIGAHSNLGIKISTDSVVNINSGLMDSRRAIVLSYLHKAIRPLNQLRMMEDATVIYRVSRAPERRLFYIDVGNLPAIKAEQYVKDVMNRYRTKMVYDSTTGEIRNDKKYLSMLEDFFLMRREGQRGTEIDTLAGGENLGVMTDVDYFKKKLYQSLSVPISRLEPQEGFQLGRIGEITRDELKFSRFVQKLRNKFSTLFDEIMRIQLVLRGVCTTEEWREFKEDVYYDYLKDNNFEELKEMELLKERLACLVLIDPYVGRYYSAEFVKKNVLHMTDDQIEEMTKQMAGEKKQNDPATPMGAQFQQAETQSAIQNKFPELMPQQPQDEDDEKEEQGGDLDNQFSKNLKLEGTINTIRRIINEK